VVTVARIVQDTNLAWALAEAIKPHLSTLERNHVFAAIGAGDALPAIRDLFKSVAIKGIPLRPDLVQQCTTWLHAYVGHNDERYLRGLIEDYLVPYSMKYSALVRGQPAANHGGTLFTAAARGEPQRLCGAEKRAALDGGSRRSTGS
jgi:hypothetical protein